MIFFILSQQFISCFVIGMSNDTEITLCCTFSNEISNKFIVDVENCQTICDWFYDLAFDKVLVKSCFVRSGRLDFNRLDDMVDSIFVNKSFGFDFFFHLFDTKIKRDL